jgi:Zn-dependent metalloprotease
MIGGTAIAAPPDHAQNKDRAIERLKAENQGAQVSRSSATGTANFVRLPPSLAAKAADAQSQDEKAIAFVSRHAEAFGLRMGSADLKLVATEKDSLGHSHLKYKQEYAGVPVFGASLKAHFDGNNELAVVSGTLVPDIAISTVPSRSAGEAGDTAVRRVESQSDNSGLSVRNSRLVVFREGLAKGTPGDSHLAYEVEVGNGVNVREFVFVDAHTGKFIDQITGIPDAMNRRAYDGNNGSFAYVLSIWPDSPFWVEGETFPTGVTEADNMLLASKETYDMFSNAFGRDSFDGAGANMDSVFDRGYSCPNASWNGAFISFCPGLTTDDVTGHEWGHAYTDYTDDLIYQWQPGALNESYSDVVGETVDMINGRGGDLPDDARTAGSCSVFAGSPPPVLTVIDGSAAGSYFSTASVNEPALPFTVGPSPMAHANPADGCAAMDDVSGQIVIIDWEDNGAPSQCGSGTRAANAIAANAEGIIFVAPASGLLNLGSNSGIGSVQVTYADGEAIKAGLPADATFSIELGTDNSVVWLMGEDSTAAGLSGALRDMWTPGCMGDPGKVSDEVYHCATSDQGGVHSNSGVPNHAFSLLVDGGNFNGQTVGSIGLTKANHIYFRAKMHYQGPATGFASHADALEQSCSDLIGSDLASLTDGSPSGEIITAADCDAVASAMLAVEMRMEPVQCEFEPLLAKNPPPLCDSPTKSSRVFFQDDFERGESSLDRWTISHFAVTPEDFTERDWDVVSDLPDDRAGRAFFAPDPTYGTCAPGGDESAVLHLDSPQITIPASAKNLRVAFDHWLATEFGWDGGNLKISVNGGPWEIVNFWDFVYNSYNIFLAPPPDNTNPIAGEQAFSGGDEGSVSGSWGRSIIDLSPYAQPKDKIRLRFDMGNDGCSGAFGWYVDDLSVYECR